MRGKFFYKIKYEYVRHPINTPLYNFFPKTSHIKDQKGTSDI